MKLDLRRAVQLLENGEWEAAHAIVQEDEDSRLFCWAHGIVHILEGDRSNARYWYRKAERPFDEDTAAPAEIKALKAEIGL
ncbi:MAG: hypothetical protein ACJ8G4_16585 [Burkholderiales bacterium]